MPIRNVTVVNPTWTLLKGLYNRNSPSIVHTCQSSVSRTTTSNLVPCLNVVSNHFKYSKLPVIYQCVPEIVLDSCLAPQLQQVRSLY